MSEVQHKIDAYWKNQFDIDGEKTHTQAILAQRGNARRGNLKRGGLFSIFKPTVEELFEAEEPSTPEWPLRENDVEFMWEEFQEYWMRVRRNPDAWEVIGNRIVLFEVDGTHQTTLQKMQEYCNLADALYGVQIRGDVIQLELLRYDVASDTTMFWNAQALISLLNTLEYELIPKYGDQPLVGRLPCTWHARGLDLSILDGGQHA